MPMASTSAVVIASDGLVPSPEVSTTRYEILAAVNGKESKKKTLKTIYRFKIIDWRTNN